MFIILALLDFVSRAKLCRPSSVNPDFSETAAQAAPYKPYLQAIVFFKIVNFPKFTIFFLSLTWERMVAKFQNSAAHIVLLR